MVWDKLDAKFWKRQKELAIRMAQLKLENLMRRHLRVRLEGHLGSHKLCYASIKHCSMSFPVVSCGSTLHGCTCPCIKAKGHSEGGVLARRSRPHWLDINGSVPPGGDDLNLHPCRDLLLPLLPYSGLAGPSLPLGVHR